jgi:hypothetical protein
MFRAIVVFFLILVIVSCNKPGPLLPTPTPPPTDTFSIAGTWTWVNQTGPSWDIANQTADTMIHRTLVFDTATAIVLITHNDSIPAQNYLQVSLPLIMVSPEIDTATFEVTAGANGCAFISQQILTIDETQYGIQLSADTLRVYPNPCVSKALDTYIRSN